MNSRLLRFTCLLLVVVLLAGFYSVPAAAQTPAPTVDTAAIDAYIQNAMRTLPYPGISLGLIHNGEVVYFKGYGKAGPDGRTPTPQTIFCIGSVGKTFTAMAVMQLVNQGKLSLDTPLKTYLPEFTTQDADRSAHITLRHLLAHASGFTRPDGASIQAYDPSTTPAVLLDYIAGLSLSDPPGTHTEYSNLNFILLGMAVERVSDMPYTAYVEQHIFAPLEMKHTYFKPDQAALDDFASGYQNLFGILVPHNTRHVPIQESAGFVYSSAEDMTHFMLTYMNDGYYQQARLFEPLRPDNQSAGDGWLTEYFAWVPGDSTGKSAFHEGATNTANSAMLIHPSTRSAVILLTNASLIQNTPNAPGAGYLSNAVLNLMLGFTSEALTDGGYHQYYRNFDLLFGALFLLPLFELFSSLFLWPRWLKSPRRVRKIVFVITGRLDLLLALGIFLLPTLQHTDWCFVLGTFVDINLAAFAFMLIFFAAALLKVRLLLRHRPGIAQSTQAS